MIIKLKKKLDDNVTNLYVSTSIKDPNTTIIPANMSIALDALDFLFKKRLEILLMWTVDDIPSDNTCALIQILTALELDIRKWMEEHV